jgi:hypothetical protein
LLGHFKDVFTNNELAKELVNKKNVDILEI